MSTLSAKFNLSAHSLFCGLILLGLLLGSQPAVQAPLSNTWVDVIVQGRPDSDLTDLVMGHGGQVTRELGLINAVAARLPVTSVSALESDSSVVRIWSDSNVRTTDSADPGTVYSPLHGAETKPAGFDLAKVATCDGSKENLDYFPDDQINPHTYQVYSFTPSLDPNSMPAEASLRFVFKEKSLNQAQLWVYQASTGRWHTFSIDTLNSDDAFIDANFDLNQVLVNAQDWADVEVRFLASHNASYMTGQAINITGGREMH